MRCVSALTLLLLSLGQLSGTTLVKATITMKEIESFDRDAARDKASTILGDGDNPSSSRSSVVDIRSEGDRDDLPRPRTVGQLCNNEDSDRGCQDNLACTQTVVGRRCFPTSADCLANLATDFDNTFDYDALAEEILARAGIDLSDLGNARRSANNFEEYQETDTFKAFAHAFQVSAPLDALRNLQTAADECMAMSPPTPSDRMLLENGPWWKQQQQQQQPESPSSDGTIVYVGLHLEVGAIADVAMSVFWALGDNDEPTAFIRGTFGVEAGAGAEMVGLLGFAFTGTTSDILGSAVAFDADVAVIFVGLGIAIIQNSNGLTSLEFTGIGPGLGFGLFGIAYAITGELNPSPAAPSLAPTPTAPAPTVPAPTVPAPTAPAPTVPAPTARTCLQKGNIIGNEACANAYTVFTSGGGIATTGTLSVASYPNSCANLAGCGCIGSFAADWFTFTSPTAKLVTVKVGSDQPVYVYVQEGTDCNSLDNCQSLLVIGTCPMRGENTFTALAGVQYNIAVGIPSTSIPSADYEFFVESVDII